MKISTILKNTAKRFQKWNEKKNNSTNEKSQFQIIMEIHQKLKIQ